MTIRKRVIAGLLAASLLPSAAPYAGAEEAAGSSGQPVPAVGSQTEPVVYRAGSSGNGNASSTSASSSASPNVGSTDSTIAVYLDGKLLQPETEPLNVSGTVLVPMRGLFEALGAKLSWNRDSKTVTAAKAGTTLIYRIGEPSAQLNGQALPLSVPGQIVGGYTMVPLRFVSEALGSSVDWDAAAKTVRITSELKYETTVKWGVNLRSAPNASADSVTKDMLPTGEKVHVVREAGPLWLEVRTRDRHSGYISAKPKYTDYSSPSLIALQADELIAYGKKYLGAPYEFGASPDQTDTFDCSSFVQRVFQDTLAIELPRVSYDQAKEGTEVKIEDLRKGDLLFFSARGLDIGHVGIYAGNNEILHTYSKNQGVHIEPFTASWRERFVTARRVF
ncbi:stalk domain-containing protein [Paenibacillus puldeungensis]|uniref:Stalk domain-containing protein n=1 Tax=Paenibacillus puldeungensis TaxID=696536 RepID=A0ABW3RZ51_9BACL